MTDIPVIVLPDPDSPTRPTVSPAATANDTPSTGRTVPPAVSMSVRSPRTSSRVTSAPVLCGAGGAGGAARGRARAPRSWRSPRGSRASAIASPRKFAAMIVTVIAAPGNVESHHAVEM